MNIVLVTARRSPNKRHHEMASETRTGEAEVVMTEDSEGNNVVIVPLRDFAFDYLLENQVYAYPASSDKKVFDYIAFYRANPVSAITHYGEVESVQEGDINMKYRAICFGDKANEDAIIVQFSYIEDLENAVEGARYGVQGRMYTNLESLLAADTLQDLK
jgi:hypothetical protein